MIPEDWLSITLGQACKEKIKTGPFGSQLHAHEYVESGIPVIMPKDLLNGNIIIDKAARISQEKADVLSKHKLENGDLIFSRRGNVTCAAIVTVKEVGCICGTGCLRVRLDKNCVSPPFLNALIQNENVKDWLESNAVGQTMLNLNTTILSNLPIQIPPLLEQCRIAEVLGVWDESIDLLERLIGRVRSRKQGLMQQLLTGKKRFKEFEGSEWKRYHFKDIFKRITRKNTVNNSNILTISGTHGLINQRDFFNKRVAADNLDGYYLIEKGEFAYNKSYSNSYPLGAIKRLDRYDAGVLSTLYICFGLSNSLNSGDFMAHYFESGIFNKEIYGIAQEGARNHGLLNIGVNDFFELFLHIPPLPEQEKIAAVLSAADEEISTLEKQLAAYKQQKLGLMQQLLTGRIRI
jgi:type I restriction enzyme, S subunit